MMAQIRRTKSAPQYGFTQIPNDWLRHPTMGLAARAVLGWLISQRDGWVTSRASLVAQNEWLTDHQARKALTELQELGILVISQEQVDGRFGGGEWLIVYPGDTSDDAQLDESDDEIGRPPSVGIQPTVENDDEIGRLPSVGSQLVKNTKEEHQVKNTNTRASASDDFDRFWAAYPRHHGKAAALKSWQKAIKRERADIIIDAAAAYAEHPNRPELAFVPHASTWLNQDRWTDPPPVARSSSSMPSDRAADTIRLGRELQRELDSKALTR